MRILAIVVFILLIMRTDLIAAGLSYGITVLRGNCAQLVIGEDDLTSKCEQKLLQTAVNEQNIDFYFSTTDGRLYIFNGTDGVNPSPDTDITQINKVIFSENEKNTDYPASGRCSYGNPYKGRTTVLCSGTLQDNRRFDATFITDGQPPDNGESTSGRFIPPIPKSGAPSMNADVEQGYAQPSPSNTLRPSDEAGSFTLNMCNKTQVDISVAIYSKYNTIISDRNYIVFGWLTAPKGTCKSFPNLAKGDFAFYASDAAGHQWAGKDRRLCVEAKAFQRVYFEKYTCSKDLVRGFTNIGIAGDQYTLNFSR